MAVDSTVEFTVISYDDWEVLYNGNMVYYQGHHVTVADLASLSKGQPFALRFESANGALAKYVYDNACFPDELASAIALNGMP